MKLVSQMQMREMDRRTIAAGRAGLALMEVAGRGILRSLLTRGLSVPRPAEVPIWILCGKGNNGGDGLVLARLLSDRGLHPRVLLAFPPEELGDDASIAAAWAVRAGVLLERPGERTWRAFQQLGPEAIVVDALLGTGVEGELRDPLATICARLATSRARILAVDLPSGSSGDVAGHGAGFDSSWTVTLGFAKRSFLFTPLRERLGPVDIVDLGMPDAIVDAVGWDADVPEPGQLAAWLPSVHGRTHKGRWGRLVVTGGSPGLAGAPILAARGALRTGAGLVRVAVPRGQASLVDGAVVEAMTLELPAGEDGQLLARGAEELLGRFGGWDALVLGPGLGRTPEAQRFVFRLLGGWSGPLLLDADALFALAAWGIDAWVPRARDLRAGGEPGGLVLTPHVGEMARLLGRPAEAWTADPIATARTWAQRWGVTLVLKGAPTVTAAPDGRVWVNPSGHVGLATGGSGDVLSGVIGALLAQGLPGPHAAALGSYLHGRAAELGTQGARRSLLPGDVVEALPAAIEATERETRPEDWRWTVLGPGGPLPRTAAGLAVRRAPSPGSVLASGSAVPPRGGVL